MADLTISAEMSIDVVSRFPGVWELSFKAKPLPPLFYGRFSDYESAMAELQRIARKIMRRAA